MLASWPDLTTLWETIRRLVGTALVADADKSIWVSITSYFSNLFVIYLISNVLIVLYLQALLYQQRAVLMSERVLGVDHPNTITEYVSHFILSFFCVFFCVDILLLFNLTRY